jgi:ABC-type polysaccharide/polyol phosphate export permease
VIRLVRSLLSNRRLLKGLIVRDLKARYVGSSMGFFWSVIFPILNLFVYTFVFRVILAVRFGDKSSVKDVAIWMLAGIVVWSAFAETISRATNSLVENANLIQKVVFPSGVLPVFLTISSLVNMAIGLPVVLAGVLWFGYIAPSEGQVAATGAVVEVTEEARDPALNQPTPLVSACNYCDYEHVLACPNDGSTLRIIEPKSGEVVVVEPKVLALGASLLWLPLLLVLQALFTAGLGFFLAAFNLILRDTYHVVGVLVMVWMFATPIFYPPEMVRSKGFGWILDMNPMHWLIDSYREVLLFNSAPDLALLGRFALSALVAFALGSTFFQSQRDRFPDLL